MTAFSLDLSKDREILQAEGPPSLTWVGAGRPAFLGNAGSGPKGQPVVVTGYRQFTEIFSRNPSGKGGESFRRSIECYFIRGGRSCYVIHFPQLEELPEDEAAQVLIGEDGGPGLRTGLQTLSDVEDAGTVAVPGIHSPLIQDGLVDYIRRRTSKSLLLEGNLSTEPPARFLERAKQSSGAHFDRIAWLAPVEADRLDGVPPSGPALGELETVDFRMDCPEAQFRALHGYGDLQTIGSPPRGRLCSPPSVPPRGRSTPAAGLSAWTLERCQDGCLRLGLSFAELILSRPLDRIRLRDFEKIVDLGNGSGREFRAVRCRFRYNASEQPSGGWQTDLWLVSEEPAWRNPVLDDWILDGWEGPDA